MKTLIRFRTLFLTLLILTLLCALSPLLVGVLAAVVSYDGNCYGFTDGAAPCSWWQFAQSQIFYGLLIAFVPAMFVLMGWLTAGGLWLALRRQPAASSLPTWQAILIPLIALTIGGLLIYFIPMFAGGRR